MGDGVMIVKTAKPMTVWELVSFTKNDALYDFDGYKARIMSVSRDQKVEADFTLYHRNRWWGLKKIKKGKKKYGYLAFLIKKGA